MNTVNHGDFQQSQPSLPLPSLHPRHSASGVPHASPSLHGKSGLIPLHLSLLPSAVAHRGPLSYHRKPPCYRRRPRCRTPTFSPPPHHYHKPPNCPVFPESGPAAVVSRSSERAERASVVHSEDKLALPWAPSEGWHQVIHRPSPGGGKQGGRTPSESF